MNTISRKEGLFKLQIILGSVLVFFLAACGSSDSRYIDLDDATEVSAAIAVPTFTHTLAILVPTPTAESIEGYEVEIVAEQAVWVRIIVDNEDFIGGELEPGQLIQAHVQEGLEIITPHGDHLRILIEGEEQGITGDWGQVASFIWDANGKLQDDTSELTSIYAATSTPAPPIYQLASGNASECITAGNAVRLMDLARIEIGSSYEFEPTFSPDGRQMVYRVRLPMSEASSEEVQSEICINLLELDTGLVTPLMGPRLRSKLNIQGVTFHPIRNELLLYGDSATSRIVFGEDDSVRVVPVHRYTGGVSLTGQEFSPDGKYFVRTSFTGAVFLYRDQGWEELFSTVVEPYSYLEGVYINWRPALDPAFTEDGRYFAVVGEGLQIWRTDDQSLHYQSEGAYYGDTSHLTVFGSEIAAAAPGNIYFLDVESKKINRILPAPSFVTALDYNVDGSMLAVGTGSGGLFFYDPYTNRTVTSRQAHTERITHLEFSPDGRWLATVSEDGTIALWAIP
jgi:WD40 repeat protein